MKIWSQIQLYKYVEVSTIEGKHIVDDIIFNVAKRPARGSVISISESSFSKWRIKFCIFTNYLRLQPCKFFLWRWDAFGHTAHILCAKWFWVMVGLLIFKFWWACFFTGTCALASGFELLKLHALEKIINQ